MKKYKAICLCLLIIVFTLTGCWDTKDISKLALVTAIGIDDDPSFKYKVTFEILNPSALLHSSDKRTTIIHTVTADNILTAVEKLQTKIPYTITLEHLGLILVGEESAKSDLKSIVDFIKRNPDVALRLRLLFVKGEKAQDILNKDPQIKRSITDELLEMTQSEYYNSLVHAKSFVNFVNELSEAEGKGVASGVSSEGEKCVIYRGTAIFNDWQLSGWLSENETQRANWIIGNNRTRITGKLKDSLYTYEVKKIATCITPNYENRQLNFTVNVTTDGIILEEQHHNLNLTKPENLDQLENVFSQTINNQIKEAIYTAQKVYRIDYLGFGTVLKKKDPQSFAGIDNWDKVFPYTPINVEVKSSISRIGLSQ